VGPTGRVGLVVLAVAAVLVAGMAAADSGDFKPKTLKGSWTGHWQNLDTGAAGDIVATVKFHKQKLATTIDFSGDPFGCGDPPPGKAKLPHGTGDSAWNAAGFRFDEPTAGFGDLILVYRFSNNKLTALGNAPCKPSTTFRLAGKLKDGAHVSGTIDIVAADGSRTTGKISADKG
jgi:hypothetical protein